MVVTFITNAAHTNRCDLPSDSNCSSGSSACFLEVKRWDMSPAYKDICVVTATQH